MANIIYGTIKECVGNDLAIVRVRSYGLANTLDYGNKDELTIRFLNINQNCSIKNLTDECLEMTIDEHSSNSSDILKGTGKIMTIIDSDIFYL
jgi:hypothetical protein